MTNSHLSNLPNEPISELTNYSALIITITVAVVFLSRQYFFEGWLIRTKLYSPVWSSLDLNQRRSFMVHNIGAVMKVVLIGTGLWPWVSVTFGSATPQTPLSVYSAKPTMGDFMMLTMQIFQVMYFFELFYRTKVSPVTAAHHLGTILLGQIAVALTYTMEAEPDAVQEFVLCFVWGAFDVLGQLWPHLVMITYRLYPTKHLLLARAFYATAILEAVSPLGETAVVMWLFGSLWDRWTIQMKIITPILHLVFKAAQVWSARVFWRLAVKEQERSREEQRRISFKALGASGSDPDRDVEKGEGETETETETETKNGSATTIQVQGPTSPAVFV